MNPAPETAVPAPAIDHDRWFVEKVQPHGSQLKAYLRESFPSVRDVDDVVQESFLRVWRARTYQPIAAARAFLFRVAQNVVCDLFRRERRSPFERVIDVSALDVVDRGPTALEVTCSHEEVLLLAQAIESLPVRCREIVILRKLQGVSQKEIAARLGLAVPTVQVQVARGMKKIEEFMIQRGVTRFSQ